MASTKLQHSRVQEIMRSLGDAKIVNMDASLKSLMEPMAAHIANLGDEVSLHVVCCNEYGLVTGLTGTDINEIRQSIAAIKTAIEKRP